MEKIIYVYFFFVIFVCTSIILTFSIIFQKDKNLNSISRVELNSSEKMMFTSSKNNFLIKIIGILIAAFFISSLLLNRIITSEENNSLFLKNFNQENM